MSEMMTNTSTKRRYTPKQLAHKAEYLRGYRKEHPDAVRRWREAYILRKAAKLQAEIDARGGADCGGD